MKQKSLGKRILAVLLAVFMVFTVLPVQAFAFNPDNYKATIQNVKIGAPITGSDGRKYLPATVTFTASEDLGDQNAIFFLEGYLKTKLASGKSSEGINGLGMTLIGPLKPDALDGAGSNAFSWSFSGGSGMGILKYNLPLLNPGETQTVEQSPYTGQMEVNALTVGDKVTLTIESVFNTSYIPADPVTSKGFTFTIEGESNYPKNITKSEDDDPNTWKTKFNSTNHWQECVEGPKKGEKQNNEPHSLSSEEMALNVNMPVDFDLSKPLSSENTPYLTNDSGAMQFKFSGSGFTSQFGGAEGETTTQKFYMSNFAPVTGAYEEMTALNGKVCSDCKYVQITGYRQAVAFYDESIPEIALQLEAAIDKPVTTAGQKIKLTVKIKKSASAPSVKLMLRGKDGAVNAKLISESVKEAELNASVIEEPNLAVAEPDEYSIVEIEQEWEYTMPASNVTVSIEREKTAVLHYDANGGTGTAPADQTVVVGKSVTIDDAELKKEDFNFIYWNTKADGSGDTYYAGDTITLDADTTLFAQYGGMIMIELPPVYISSIAKPFRLVELGGDYENAYIAYIPYGASTADAKAALDGIKLNLPAAYKDKLRVSSWLYYYDNDTQNELPATMTYNTIYALPMFALTGTFKVGETINIPAMYEQVYVAYWGADWDLEDDSWVFTLFEGDYELGYEGVIPATEDTPECFSFSLTPLNDEGEHDDEEDTAELYLATNGADTDPIGVKCIGGTGSYDDPYLFAPVFAIPVESIRFTAVAPTVVVGSKATLTITTDPADATTDDFVWSSDDESIATVDKGVVTGKKPGTTTITVTGKNELGEDVSATVTLTVSTSGGAKPTPSPSGGSSSTGTSGGSSSSGSVSGTKDESGNVDVTLNDNNSLTLSWKRPQGTSSTVVYAKKTGEKKFSVLAKTTKNKLSILNVKNNTTYEFKLAFISGGVEDDLGGKYNAKINVYYKPAPKATTGDGTVVLKWKAVKGATKYRVCVLDGKTLKKVGETTKTSVRIRSVKKGKTYKYAVKAQVNGKWTSVKSSDIVTVKVK